MLYTMILMPAMNSALYCCTDYHTYIYILFDKFIGFVHTSLCQRTRYRRTNPHPVAWGGVGWGGIKTSLAFPHEPDSTLYDLQLQFHMNLMLRSMIFNCNSTHPHPVGVG